MNEFDPQQFLTSIMTRPGMYLGRKSLQLFDAFLNGMSLVYNNREFNEQWRGFDNFILKKFGYRHGTAGWCRVISFFHGPEAEGFDKFVELWNEYQQERQKELEKPKRKKR